MIKMFLFDFLPALVHRAYVQITKYFEHKIVNFFISISFNIFGGAQKNRHIENMKLMVFMLRNNKNDFTYKLFPKGLHI